MYKQDFALNYLQGLICRKTQQPTDQPIQTIETKTNFFTVQRIEGKETEMNSQILTWNRLCSHLTKTHFFQKMQ